jgi:hypothetical protein
VTAKTQGASEDEGIRENQIVVTAKRALGLNKFYLAVAIAIGVGVLFFLNPTYADSSSQSISVSSVTITALPLLAIPFSVLPMMMLTTPMVVLFVYDKNNGVLEYLISLGLTQGDIFARYLKAALLVSVSYLLIFGTLNLLYSLVRFGTTYLSTMLVILGIGALMAVSTVALIIAMMMVFSSLQKSRTGGNQPLAVALGLVGVYPGFIIPFVFPYETAIAVEIVVGAIIAVAALIPILMASRLVSREKFLP